MLRNRLRGLARFLGMESDGRPRRSRRSVNREGWNHYARSWDRMKTKGEIPDLDLTQTKQVEFLGDEWSLMGEGEAGYGVSFESARALVSYLRDEVFALHLPAGNDLRILELGPGGGRVTEILLPRCRTLYAVDISAAMLERLRARFPNTPALECVTTDGLSITGIAPNSLDAVVSFDTMVHLEPHEIFRYLEIVRGLLREGGRSVLHFADVETDLGFKLFRSQVDGLLQQGADYGTFSVMCKSIMRKFLEELDFEVETITNSLLPRDAVAVFRRAART